MGQARILGLSPGFNASGFKGELDWSHQRVQNPENYNQDVAIACDYE